MERVRGRTLAWALEDRKAFPTSESEQTASLETDVAGLQARLMQSGNATEREQLLDKLVEYERRLGLAWTKGDEANTRLPAQPAPLKIVQDDLKPDEVLLEYVLDDPNSYCVLISHKVAFVRMLPTGRKEIEKLAQRYIAEIRGKALGSEASKQLYERLLKPIPEISKADRILVAPDGILHLLPFEALQDDRGQYLLKSHTISYAPSGTILDTLRRGQRHEPAPKPLLAVGDVAYENQGGAGKRLPTPTSARGRIERASQTCQALPSVTFRRRAKRLRKSVKLWDRMRSSFLPRTRLRPHSRRNRSISFVFCTWRFTGSPTRNIRSELLSFQLADGKLRESS